MLDLSLAKVTLCSLIQWRTSTMKDNLETNPYKAPASEVVQNSFETYQPQFFMASGRIGRLRFMAYTTVTLVLATLSISFMPLFGEIGIVVGLSTYLILFAFSFVLGKRRLNDMNYSGWFILLGLIPLVNILVALWLVFGKGSAGSNRFGLAPNKNPLSIKILGFALPALMLLGILAAVAIPAYEDYLQRAKVNVIE